MTRQPELQTDRLLLRPFTPNDAPGVRELAGDRDIAATTLNIPHPYEEGMAEEWIRTHREKFERGELANFAITLRGDGNLIGAIGLVIVPEHERAELGYWIGKPHWGNGYCTEAARAVAEYGFRELGLNRIHASHFSHNPASGRILQKIGMSREGCLKQHVRKWEKFVDLEVYGTVK